jgi:hypothetical protein
MAECDNLGREAFLENYGFREARSYFLEYDGKRYDSKAIVGVAHRHQFGQPLKASEFSGGDRTVASKLNELGFVVTRPADGWTIAIGQVTTRAEIHAKYGGATFGGIEPTASTPNVMIYSDPSEGEQYGYQFDGWVDGEPGVFTYTGEGRIGDQKLTDGNRAILEHARHGRVLRLFITLDRSHRQGGKRQRYAGAFRVDPDDPFEWRRAPDHEGNDRKVVVFRLLPDEVDGYPADPLAQPGVSIGTRRHLKPAHQPVVCPTHFLELSVTGECDLCG